MTRQAWVNGVYVAAEEAKISPFDRGFLFADGVYEVTAVYNGRPVDMERHLDRLERSLRELKFGAMPDRKELEEVHRRLVADNGITEGYVYLQVTRGAYGSRDFVAPDKPTLTCFAYAESRALIDTPSARNGIRVISVPDIRWARRDIKSVGLLAQAQVVAGWLGCIVQLLFDVTHDQVFGQIAQAAVLVAGGTQFADRISAPHSGRHPDKQTRLVGKFRLTGINEEILDGRAGHAIPFGGYHDQRIGLA